MQTLNKIISKYIRMMTIILICIILLIIVFIQMQIECKRANDTGMRVIAQIEQQLDKNREELEEVETDYRQTCLHNAEAIACIIEGSPEVISDIAELKKIAEMMEVDEIHIFNKSGCIVAGTHPEYYGYTFDSGEQMNFFKPMLEDKSLQLVQDITPNTAEGKMMQYSALWSRSGSFIVQVGMEPVSVMKVTEKNELSYIFSLFKVSSDANYYAVDVDTNEIVGSTDLNDVGKTAKEIGLDLPNKIAEKNEFWATVNGRSSYCVFRKVENNYVGRVVLKSEVYRRIPGTIFELALCFIVVAYILLYIVSKYIRLYVVDEIHKANEKLYLISRGNLEEQIDIRSSLEFSEFSDHINTMIQSLLSNNVKMSYVLSKTDMYIGVYEYNPYMKTVRFTEYIPMIFSKDSKLMEELASDYKIFKEYIENIRKNAIPDEVGVYELHDSPGQFVKIEQIVGNQDDIFGVVIDVTNDIKRRRQIEFERDRDLLTGLFNRRGLYIKLSELFKEPEALGYGVFIMIDADGLKTINDTYGHEKGDVYIREIAELLKKFNEYKNVAARQSGDEYILFLYQYPGEEELAGVLQRLSYLQKNSVVKLDDTISVPLKFSFGYCFSKGRDNYQEMIEEADKKMYENKRKRKENDR